MSVTTEPDDDEDLWCIHLIGSVLCRANACEAKARHFKIHKFGQILAKMGCILADVCRLFMGSLGAYRNKPSSKVRPSCT